MEFTYKAYANLIELLRINGYTITDYRDYIKHEKCAILRHDIDYSMDKAVKLALFEHQLGIKSTYFVLVSSPFYNIFQEETKRNVKLISSLGHSIGLHFDEVNYSEEYYLEIGGVKNVIFDEIALMEKALNLNIDSVSMHRPSEKTLTANYDLYPVINSYGKCFFNEFKYVSDSRRRWRENVEEIISSRKYDRLHILTHAFWYNEKEQDLRESLLNFVNSGNKDRALLLDANITNLSEIIDIEKI